MSKLKFIFGCVASMLFIAFVSINLILINISCDSNYSTFEVDIKTIQISDDDFSNPSFAIELQKIVPLETSKNSVFGEYYNLRLIDSFIFVFDQKTTKTIFKFDNLGQYIGRIEKGRAPFELVEAYAASFDELRRKLYVYDYGDKKIKVYDFDLNYLNSLVIENPFIGFSHFVKLSSGKWLSNTHYKYFQGPDSSAHFLLINSDLNEIEEKYLPIIELIEYPMIFQNPVHYDYKNLTLIFTNGFDNYIYTLDDNYRLIKLYKVDFGTFTITDKDRQNYKVHELAGLCDEGLRKGHIDYINSNDNFIGFEYTYNGNYTEFCIYSKVYKKSISSEQLRNTNYALPLGRLVHLGSDYFVCAVEPNKVIEFIESSNENRDKHKNLDIKIIDNLVLVYYSMELLK